MKRLGFYLDRQEDGSWGSVVLSARLRLLDANRAQATDQERGHMVTLVLKLVEKAHRLQLLAKTKLTQMNFLAL